MTLCVSLFGDGLTINANSSNASSVCWRCHPHFRPKLHLSLTLAASKFVAWVFCWGNVSGEAEVAARFPALTFAIWHSSTNNNKNNQKKQQKHKYWQYFDDCKISFTVKWKLMHLADSLTSVWAWALLLLSSYKENYAIVCAQRTEFLIFHPNSSCKQRDFE